MTLHHLDLYQETPVARQGSNYPSWYWTGHYTIWIRTRKHQFPARVRTTLPGIGRDATPPGIFPGTVGSPRIRATTSLVFLQDRHTTWNKSPCRRWEVTIDSPCPPSISVEWIIRRNTAAAGIEHTLPPGISQNTATPPRWCVSIRTFAANGSNPFCSSNSLEFVRK